MGLLAITLPSLAFFWYGLYRTSRYILPLRNKDQHGKAFRSMLTFTIAESIGPLPVRRIVPALRGV